ncbi:MAG TPA: hypothetical protein VMT58_04895 [Candidatus Binataceae bacterium]|nr:hypothetical protein [Candidatus Binataceae bacterium]
MRRLAASLLISASIAALSFGAGPAAGGSMSGDLANLERRVSLELAHVRDNGPTDPEPRAQLEEANRLEHEAEAAIAKGDYQTASDLLHKADALLVRLMND